VLIIVTKIRILELMFHKNVDNVSVVLRRASILDCIRIITLDANGNLVSDVEYGETNQTTATTSTLSRNNSTTREPECGEISLPDANAPSTSQIQHGNSTRQTSLPDPNVPSTSQIQPNASIGDDRESTIYSYKMLFRVYVMIFQLFKMT
jgi:hypothetical protein